MPTEVELIKRRFKQSIRCGTGRAVLLQRAHPTIDFSKPILDATINHYAYDPQSEGDRCDYLLLLIKECARREWIIDQALTTLEKTEEDDWECDQLIALATQWAKEGNSRASALVHAKFLNEVAQTVHWTRQHALVELEGENGVLQIAQKRGEALKKGNEDRDDADFINYLDREFPQLQVWKIIKKAARNNPTVAFFLQQTLQQVTTRRPHRTRPQPSYQLVKERIDQVAVVPAPPGMVAKLTSADLQQLANDFLQETQPLRQEKYLRVFTYTRFPDAYHHLLTIAKKQNPQGTRLVEFACKSLQYFQAVAIRQFAITKLAKTNQPARYLYLLVANFKSADAPLLTKIIQYYQDDDRIHDLVWGLVAIYKANPTKECLEPVLAMYEKLTCGIHRYDLVKIMHQHHQIPAHIQEELAFDSYEGVRELANEDPGSRS